MQGLKWPIQFFMVKIYQMGDKKESDSFYYFPKQQVFKCYNSFSVSSSLDKQAASEEDFNTDAAVDHKANWKGFSRQFVPLASFFFCSAVGVGWFIWYAICNFTSTSVSGGASSPTLSGQGDKELLKNRTSVTIKLLTPSLIAYSDKFTIKKGTYYHGYKVEKITPDYVVLSHAGVFDRYSLSALRPEASAPGVRGQIAASPSGQLQQPLQQPAGLASPVQPPQPRSTGQPVSSPSVRSASRISATIATASSPAAGR